MKKRNVNHLLRHTDGIPLIIISSMLKKEGEFYVQEQFGNPLAPMEKEERGIVYQGGIPSTREKLFKNVKKELKNQFCVTITQTEDKKSYSLTVQSSGCTKQR